MFERFLPSISEGGRTQHKHRFCILFQPHDAIAFESLVDDSSDRALDGTRTHGQRTST